jgi:hypothetical protein
MNGTDPPKVLPSIYNCKCTLSSAQIADAKDIVQYAQSTNLVANLLPAVKDGRDTNLLAVIACSVVLGLDVLIGLPVVDAELQCKTCPSQQARVNQMYPNYRQRSPSAAPLSGTPLPPSMNSQTTTRRDYSGYNKQNNNVPAIALQKTQQQQQTKGMSYVARRRSNVMA